MTARTEPAGQVLLLGHEKEHGLRLVRVLSDAGYEPVADSWAEFNPRAYGRKKPRLVLADVDDPGAPGSSEFEGFCRTLRKAWGEDYPLLATAHSNKFADAAKILDAGATDYLPKNAAPDRVGDKIAKWMRDSLLKNADGEVPEKLLELFVGDQLVKLADIADIYPGASPRRAWCRRMAPPDDGWRGVVGADAVDRFFVGRPSGYLLWSRFHLFRLPAPREYSVPEKVLLSRIGPPLAAAVDRSRSPAGGDVYSIVPKEGVSAGFIACVLNSRLMDFYFNRLVGGAGSSGGRLRPESLKSAPFPRPSESVLQELNRASALLSHFGPNPQSWIDRQSKDELWLRMEDAVFAAFGAGEEAKESLAALHF